MAVRRRRRPDYILTKPDDFVPQEARPNWSGEEDRFEGIDDSTAPSDVFYRTGGGGSIMVPEEEGVKPKIGFRSDRILKVQTVDPDKPVNRSDPHIHVLANGRAVDDRKIGTKYSHRDDWQSRDRRSLSHGLKSGTQQIVDKHTRVELLDEMDSVRRDFMGARGNKEMTQRLESEMKELREIAEAEAQVRDIVYHRTMHAEHGRSGSHNGKDDDQIIMGMN
ncbi:MAG: hypothetical protein MRY32_09850 [Rickettsiales bacterium]|nr:hypothetical protein [Rickettsiales bacterium]